MKHNILKLALALVASALLAPVSVKAQDCGLNCMPCMIFGKEAINYHILANYNMTCMFQASCGSCRVERAVGGADAEALLTLIKTGTENDVRKAIQNNREQLRIVPSRGLVAFRGSKCDPNALVAVIYVDRDRAELLKKSGVALLPQRIE